ncbi:outer membrane beta-barrel protein [Helicobacter heilmannii]|uniref:outer membrane beta-barrel protein n=1 Tax=Helicobacter heilmannii TaxID=35817 RepID=UPI0025564B6B|nr:outer membrane beta-barrel protein [Helicobacter heilmannii]
MRTFLAMGLVWAWMQAQPLPALVAVSDMLEEDPRMGGPTDNLQPYLLPEGELQRPKPQPQSPQIAPHKYPSKPTQTIEDDLHVLPSKVQEDTKVQDFQNPNRLRNLDEQIQNLKEQIKDMGVVPQTQYKSSKSPKNTHAKYTRKDKRARKALNRQIGKDKSGFFLGGGYGWGLITESYNSQQAKSVVLGTPEQQEMFSTLPNLSGAANMMNVELGYQQYFNPYFGTRIYGDLLFIPGFGKYTTLNGNTTPRGFGGFFYGLGSLNMDMLFDAPLERQKKHFIGAYAGFGVGLMVLKDKRYNAFSQVVQAGFSSPDTLWHTLVQVDYTINLGVAFTYNRHLRFEVGTKIPITYLRLGFETPAIYTSKSNSQQLISEDTGFKRSSLLVMNILYAF